MFNALVLMTIATSTPLLHAHIHVQDLDGRTPLHLCAQRYHNNVYMYIVCWYTDCQRNLTCNLTEGG